jgi:hypothetical protein
MQVGNIHGHERKIWSGQVCPAGKHEVRYLPLLAAKEVQSKILDLSLGKIAA